MSIKSVVKNHLTTNFGNYTTGRTYTYSRIQANKRELRRAHKLVCAGASCPMVNPNNPAKWVWNKVRDILGPNPAEGATLAMVKYIAGVK